ncbi:MAG: bifunctional folylpolyglutamate synthase/dihydrofolate synthase [Pirellulales bacterium]|nr:bifunctional folylpolyglutamate synthase/dihydrofolate synthase [Pirellulales bacterium]
MSLRPTLDPHAAALEFLYGRIDYERALNVPYRPQEFKLQRMRRFLDRLENPHHHLPIIHVAGTKGKGSTAAMIGAVLTVAGYRTGVFSSPHLDRIEQRLAVAGQPCSSDELVELVDRIRPAVEAMDREASAGDPDEIGPTYFEITTAMALLHFLRRQADAAVLEVGLGGRLDSTNVCRPCVSVITSISFDHTKQLGNTLGSIAREKAGIVKPGVPVVSGVVEDEPRQVIREICRRCGCRLVERGVDFDFRYYPPRGLEQAAATGKLDFLGRAKGDATGDGSCQGISGISLRMLGHHQAANAAVAMAALHELRQAGWNVPEQAVRTGLAEAVCPARVEVVARRPTIVIDAAHNPASIEALLRVLDESFSVARRRLIFATTREKDLRGMLGCVLDRFDQVVFTQYLDNLRAVPPEELAALAHEASGREYAVYRDPADALAAVRALAGPDELVCITGSFFIAAAMRRRLVLPCEPAADETGGRSPRRGQTESSTTAPGTTIHPAKEITP